MGSVTVTDQYTPLDVLITGVSTYEHHGHHAATGYTQIGEGFYKLAFGTVLSQWETFCDALTRGEHPLAVTDNKSLWSIELTPDLPQSLQEEISRALIRAHDRSLDSIG